jgi:CheY-like chemotaxis protein/signal transduction histidine kinase
MGQRTPAFRTLSSKYSFFTAVLVFWVVSVFLLYDLQNDRLRLDKGMALCFLVVAVVAFISRFTMTALSRPLANLQAGLEAARDGRLEQIRVSRTGDEIEYLGTSFNAMIEGLNQSKEELRRQQAGLEEKVRERTAELEQASAQAKAASAAKTEFLTNLSHELRTPLSGLIGMLNLVAETRLPAETHEHLEAAQRSAQALLALVNDLHDLSKIESGTVTLERSEFDVASAVLDCLREWGATGRGQRFRLEKQDLPPRVVGDPVRVRQIVSNLVGLAVAAGDGATLRVRLTGRAVASGWRVEIAILNPGPASFFSELESRDGLGFSIARRLAELHDGLVRIDPADPVRLVAELGFGAAAAAPETASPGQTTTSLAQLHAQVAPSEVDILVVEDNAVNQRLVQVLLERAGYRVTVAATGAEALQALERTPGFALVLMDVQMPDLDGFETTRRIRQDLRWAGLPIVAMTAHAMAGDDQRCLEAGMNGYLAKPVDAAHLREAVTRFTNGAAALARPVEPVAS